MNMFDNYLTSSASSFRLRTEHVQFAGGNLMEELTLFEYVIYLGASVVLTVWVGRTLYVNGRRFLVEVMADENLADSVNHLLLVGFYLVNIGVAALLVNATGGLGSPAAVVRTLATQLGIVLLVLGGMHF